jgi:SAM-dependent methyltransferase
MAPGNEADAANAAQAHHWNVEAGPGWVARQEQLDRMLAPLGNEALSAARPAAGERAIDIGCGCGATTIALAERVGTDGRVFGVDISEPMLERARERCAALGLTNVELLCADAQRALVPRGNDLAFSRFGIMFFDHPVVALGNIGRGLRKDGRLAFVCWQERARNPWMGVPLAAALQHVPPPPPQPPDAPGPWAFADRDRLAHILDAAGFDDVAIEPVEHDLLVGGADDLDGAVGFAIDSGSMRSVLGDIDESTRARVADSIRVAFEPYVVADGVRIPSATWVVSARRAVS